MTDEARYDEGVEDADLDLEASGLHARRLLRHAEHLLDDTPIGMQGLAAYRRGRRDRFEDAVKEVNNAEGRS